MKVLVVGGGISGLAAAVALADAGVDTELWEASPRIGGKLRTSPFAGVAAVDEGADAYLTRVPHAVAFATRVGLAADELTAPRSATAAVWHERLHDLPSGIVLGVPADVRPFATTGLLSWRGKLRAAAEPVLPRRFGRRPTDHDSIGTLVRGRFGNEVHERLVDSLVGSIYATDTDHASLASVPQLAHLADAHRSLLWGARAMRRTAPVAPNGEGSVFAAPSAGMEALAAAAAVRLVAAGAVLRTATAVADLEPDGGAWRANGERFDQVILAAPAHATAALLRRSAATTADTLAAIEYADIAMVRLAVTGDDWPDRLRGRSGYLVPKPDQRIVTAASFGSQKWAHWSPADGSQVLRISLGRDGLPIADLDDAALLAAAIAETGRHLDLDLQPSATSVTRWVNAFPQYRPHHQARVAAAVASLPAGLHLAGASYHGIGVPACIASGLTAAERICQTGG